MTYASFNPAVSPRERENYALARRAAREGFVLLKNDNGALPLTSKKVALYGAGARRTLKGGVGSGEVNERYSVNIEQGLLNTGYEVTTQAWLDDFDAEHTAAYAQWKEFIAKETAGINRYEVLRLAKKTPFCPPDGREITQQDVDGSDTDTAIFVVSRQAGESFDRKYEKGDWFLTDTEYSRLQLLAASYAKTILVINAGGPIDMNFLKEIDGIDAVVFMAQGGMEGGNALAEVFSGYYNFSGKLTDSWAQQYEDHPSAKVFSYMDGDVDHEEYLEGIYVGYRYFDRFGVKPRYPFGYGLSYTDFALSPAQVSLQGSTVSVSLSVKNTGAAYAGREVVQLYVSCPQGKLEKETKRMAAFAKTAELQPGQEETMSMSFDMRDAASYDEARAAWILEEGDYVVYVGRNAADITPEARITLDAEVVTEQCRTCCAPAQPIEEIVPPAVSQEIPAGIPSLVLDAALIKTIRHDYSEPVVQESPWVKKKLDQLTLEEMGMLVRGAGVEAKAGEHLVLGAGGKTATCLADKGIRNVIFSDGPAGLNIAKEIKIDTDGMEYATSIAERWNIGDFAKEIAKRIRNSRGRQAYRYATAFPVHILLAQSWDTALVEEVGRAEGQELLDFGVTVWLAPGMNIHRNPLGGRTFEYFSEDPVLSGKMAAAITKGVQSHKGVGVSLKHFACNSQEENRSFGSSDINERAMREIYLKGFEIAVKESDPMTVMSSYNKINGIFNGTNRDLLTNILRCEWGFGGLVMTDFNSRCEPELCAPAGNDLYMYGADRDKEAILSAIADGRLTEKELRPCAARVLTLVENSAIYAK